MEPKTELRLKPASTDVTVRDPDTLKPLAAKGETKPLTQYWLRRLRDGDVIDLNAPKPAVKTTESTT